jgi:hypothetical protein
MSWVGWTLVGLAAWLVVSAVTAPLVGRWLGRVGEAYPEPDEEPDNPWPSRQCIERDGADDR